MLELSLFIILAIFLLGGAITVLFSHETVFGGFGFLVTMIALAGLFALLESQFLAIAQIMVSVGAVVVLSMLTILSINIKEEDLPDEPHKFKWIALSAVIITPFTYLLYKVLTESYQHFANLQGVDAKVVGELLFSDWVFAFEIVSILLLSAMVGAIVIARKHGSRGAL